MACPMPRGCAVPWAHGVPDSKLPLAIPKISISMIKVVPTITATHTQLSLPSYYCIISQQSPYNIYIYIYI